MMRVELRDHSKPCEHRTQAETAVCEDCRGTSAGARGYATCDRCDSTGVEPAGGAAFRQITDGDWMCAVWGCPGGALRVFTYDGAGKALSTNNSGSGEFEGRKWQRWVEWLNDEGNPP